MKLPKIGLEEALDSIREQVSIQDKNFIILFENKARKEYFGKDNTGKKCFEAYRSFNSPCPDCVLKPILEERVQKSSGILEFKERDGSIKYFEISATPYFDKNGNLLGGIEVIRDITERINLQMRLERETIMDYLTGIYNRRGLDDKLRTLKQLSKVHNHPLSLCFIDMDFLKQYNDSFGHEQGDIALKTLAKILANTARPGDVYGRSGGEEFLFILPETSLEESIEIAQSFRSSIEATRIPVLEGINTERIVYKYKTPEKITVSIGLSSFPETSQLEFLIGDADKALYRAKEEGRNKLVVYKK